MSEEKKEVAPTTQNSADEVAREEFLKALKKGGDEGLKEAFQVLGKGASTTRVNGSYFQLAITTRDGPNLPLENINNTIQQVPKEKEGEFNCEEFVHAIKLLEEAVARERFVNVVKGGDEGLKEAFRVLSKGAPTTRVDDAYFQLAIITRDGPNLPLENINNAIKQVHKEKEGEFNCEEFVHAIKFLEEFVNAVKKGGDEGLKEAFQVLSKGAPTTRIDDSYFQIAIISRDGPNLPLENIKNTIQQISKEKEGEFNCDKFIHVVKLLEEAVSRERFVNAVKKGGDEGLKEAFQVLSKGASTTRADGFYCQLAITTRGGLNLPLENINNVIQHVLKEKEGEFNCEEFVHIIKFLEEFVNAVKKGSDEGLKEAFQVLGKAMPHVDGSYFRLAITTRGGPNLPLENINNVIQHILKEKEGEFNSEDFVHFIKFLEEFVNAVKKGGDEGLKEAFQVLSKGAPTTRVDGSYFQLAITTQDGPNLSLENINNAIQQISKEKEGEFNCEEFVHVIKSLEEVVLRERFVNAVKKGGDEGLKEAFQVLGKGAPTTRVDGTYFQLAIIMRGGPNLLLENINNTIQQVPKEKEGGYNCEEFVHTVKFLEGFVNAIKKGGEEGLKEAFQVLSKGAPTTRIDSSFFQLAITARVGPNLPLEIINNSIQHVPRDKGWEFNCEEFVHTITFLEGFVNAVKKDGDEGLKEAFQVLSKGAPTTRVDGSYFQIAIISRDGPNLPLENIKNTIQQISKEKEGEFNSEDFVHIIKFLEEFVNAVKKGGDEGLKEAFQVLSKGAPTTRVDGSYFQLAITTRDGPNLSLENINNTIQQISNEKEGVFNCEEFVHVIKLLEEVVLRERFVNAVKKGGDEGLREAFQVLGKGAPTTCVDGTYFQLAIITRGGHNLLLENINNTIQQVPKEKEGEYNCEEFVHTVKLLEGFVNAIKKGGEEGLKEAFHVLSKGAPTTRVDSSFFQLAITIRVGPNIPLEIINNSIQHVPREKGWEFNCEEFVHTMRFLEGFVNAVKKDGDEGLKEAFQVLSKGAPTTRVDGSYFQIAITTRNPELTSINEWIQKVLKEKDEEFSSSEFVRVIKFLEKPDEKHQSNAIKKQKIYEKLIAAKEGDTIILHGVEGVGKTWMAREVATHAMKNEAVDVVIWLFLNRNYEGLSLHESVAYQTSVLAAFEQAEAEGEKEEEEKGDEAKEEEKEKEEKGDKAKKKKESAKMPDVVEKVVDELNEKKKTTMNENERKKEEMLKRINKVIRGKKLLFILDNQGSKITAEIKRPEKDVVVLKLKDLEMEFQGLKSHKVLITRRNVNKEMDTQITINPLTLEDSMALAIKEMGREGVEEIEKAEKLALYFMLMMESERLPTPLLVISRIVAHFAKQDSEMKKLESYREEIKNGGNVLDVLIRDYSKIPKRVLIDCYSPLSPAEHFLRQDWKVNFNALICYWIIEGHLGHFDRVEDAYFQGHNVLMELMNCGLLQKQESDYVLASGNTKFNLDILDYQDFFKDIRPGLAVTFDMRLGRVAVADGMIKTVGRSNNIISTLLLDGNRISQEESPLQKLTEDKEEVQVLAINEPTKQHFELPILEMRKLRLLVLRGCTFLEKLEDILWKKMIDEVVDGNQKPEVNPSPTIIVEKPEVKPPARVHSSVASEKLESLKVFEISGPASFKIIPQHIFNLMPNLRTLNLSYLHEVDHLPKSFYQLTQIEFLILRGCKRLKELKSLKTFKELKALDVSNATSFEKFEDKSLQTNSKLQVLNLSNTMLKTLPLINQLSDLKFVWLRDCAVLPRIRKIDKLKKLQILDIAGAQEVERFCDPSLEDLESLVIVDISRTAIKRLPANMGDPKYIYAKNCSKIRVVPPVEGLTKLEVLHLSGCERLRTIRSEFFEKVKGLKELDISKTKVRELDFLPSLISLQRLLLSECESLKELKLSKLKELEYLDLSGCKALNVLEENTFDKMIHLQHLDISGTALGGEKQLPSLSKLESLKTLYVRDCPNLTELPGVDKVSSLEVLDYSGTVLKSPPVFSNPDKPQVIGAGLEKIQADQLSRNLDIELQSHIQGKEWVLNYGDVSSCKWDISNWRMEAAEKSGTPVYGAHFLLLLKEQPSFLKESAYRFLVHPSGARLPDPASYKVELSLRDIYFKQVCETKFERSLEIRGFDKLPTSLMPLLSGAQFLVLVNDPFLTSFLDLGLDKTMDTKVCWIESCNELKHVVLGPEKVKEDAKPEEATTSGSQQKKADAGMKSEGDQHKKNNADAEKTSTNEGDKHANADAEKSGDHTEDKSVKSENNQPKNDESEKKPEELTKDDEQSKNEDGPHIQNLWISDVFKLESILKGDVQTISFKFLTSLYIEYCPNLSHLTSSSSQLPSLQTLFIKYCQKLTKLFEDSNPPHLDKLINLQLWGLDSLKKLDYKAPSLKKIRVGQCPLLKHVIPSRLGGDEESQHENEAHENLEVLHIQSCDNLQRICDGEDLHLESLKRLELMELPRLEKVAWGMRALGDLRVSDCPSLKIIVGGGELPELVTMEVRSCESLEKIIDGGELKKIEKIELLGLPKLVGIGAKFPDKVKPEVCACPKLDLTR